MKRSGPLKRNTPFKRGGSLRTNAPLKRPGTLSRAKKLVSRRKPSMDDAERLNALRWFTHAMYVDGQQKSVCAVGGPEHGSSLEVHHIVPKQILKREGFTDRLWDDRNALVLCRHCHARHEHAVLRVPFAVLTVQAQEFADELSLGWVLERYYDTKEAP